MSEKKELNQEQLEKINGGFVGYQKGKYYVDLSYIKLGNLCGLEFGPKNSEQEAKTVAENKADELKTSGCTNFKIQTKYRNENNKWDYGTPYSY